MMLKKISRALLGLAWTMCLPVSAQIEEIVVTAQKTTESLQDTSAAVTVLTQEMFVKTGVTDLRDTQMLVPAARFQKEGSTTQVFVRGVGSNLDYGNIEPTVAFNFNGVFMPREGTSTAFYDLESMEVLPGPQGTLYGRSAMGGTVNVSFAKPEMNNDGMAKLEVGNYSLIHATYAQNFSNQENFAARVAIDYIDRDGYNVSGADSQDDIAGRLSIQYDPNEDLSVYLWAFSAEKGGHPPNLVNHGLDPETRTFSRDAFLTADPWNDLRLGDLSDLTIIGQAEPEERLYEIFSFGGQIDWQIGDKTLTYIPGYTNLDSNSNYWLGVVPAAISQNYDMHSHELRLSGASDRLEWLLGGYYYDQENNGDFVVFFNLLNLDIRNNELNGFGVFGQATYSLSDEIRIILGGRYSSDEREADGFGPEVLASPTTAPTMAFAFSNDYSNVDWKLGVEWDVAPDIMTYLVAQTAYAPGTYNSTASTATFDNSVDEADLTAFALGMKSQFLDGTLQINPEVFHYTYNDLIIQAFDQSVLFNPVFNAQEVIIYGTQIDVLWVPTDTDRINFNLGYTHARNEEFVTPTGDDFTGLAPPYSPDWTVLLGYSKDFAVKDGNLNFRINGRYESEWWADYVHNLGTEQSPNVKVDSALTFQQGDWEVGLWIKNITDEAVLAATAAAGFPGPATAYLESPRTFGARFMVNF